MLELHMGEPIGGEKMGGRNHKRDIGDKRHMRDASVLPALRYTTGHPPLTLLFLEAAA